MHAVVAIIGRPNVGKSTLFNRLVGRRAALVHPTPGVTRDRREGEGNLAGLGFTVIDTAGLEEAVGDTLGARIQSQTHHAVADSDIALLLIDARAGITPFDRYFAHWARRSSTPVVLVANKCEGMTGQSGLFEAFELGLGDPIPISAEHGEGMADLRDALAPYISDDEAEEAYRSALEDEETEAAGVLSAGVDLVDVKEPAAGSLGAAAPAIWKQVVDQVAGSTLISLALGELTDQALPERLAEIPAGIRYAKIGLAGCQDKPGWKTRWGDVD